MYMVYLYVYGMFICIWYVCMYTVCLYVYGMFVCIQCVYMYMVCLYVYGMFVRLYSAWQNIMSWDASPLFPSRMFNHCIDWRHLASAVVPIARVHLLLGGVPFTCHGSVARLSLILARYGWRWFTWTHGSSTCVLGVCRCTRTHQFTRSVPADLVRVALPADV